MKRFKSQIRIICVICVLILICGICGTGCDQTSGERIAAVKNLVNQASGVNASIDASLADINTVIASCEFVLADPNIPDDLKPQVQAALIKAKAKLDYLKAQKQKAVDILAAYKPMLDSIDTNSADINTELAVYGKGGAALGVAVGGKAGGVIYLLSALIPLVGGLVASVIKNLRQSGQLKDSKAVLEDVVSSVNQLLESDQVKDIEEAKFLLQDSQAGATQDAVDAVKEVLAKS